MSLQAVYLCPLLPISATISTGLCQHSDTAQCNVIWRSNMTHKNCCYFNVLLYLTSPILTECETQLSLTIRSISTVTSVTSRSSFLLVHVFKGGQFHVLVALFAGPVEKEIMWEFTICKILTREKSLVHVWYLSSLGCPVSSLVTILTELPRIALALRTWLIQW
jgi:hypothetical protein